MTPKLDLTQEPVHFIVCVHGLDGEQSRNIFSNKKRMISYLLCLSGLNTRLSALELLRVSFSTTAFRLEHMKRVTLNALIAPKVVASSGHSRALPQGMLP